VGENVLQCKLNMVFCCSASGTGALPLNSKKKTGSDGKQEGCTIHIQAWACIKEIFNELSLHNHKHGQSKAKCGYDT
jgi:hypothetical protein